MIAERLAALRREMEERNIAVYIVPTADFHESEYVGAYFKARAFITGFTGSAGTAVVTMTEAGLWTDGRYFVQAAAQLEDCVTLYKMGEEGVPTVDEYVEGVLKEGETIGFDGRVVNAGWGKKLCAIADRKHGALSVDEDLIDRIWTDRPTLSAEPVRVLDVRYTGKSTKDKLADVRAAMAEKGADWHLLSSLYDIAWLLNVRGNDISYVPVVLSYLALSKDACIWFVQEKAVDEGVLSYMKENGIEVQPYESFYDFVGSLSAGTVQIDEAVVNYRIRNSIGDAVTVVADKNPEALMKAVKNETELANTKSAHVKDAVAMCRFMYWLKKNIGSVPMTELSVTEYLYQLRREQEGFLDLSFETICGYGAHGAIVHYAATPESDVPLAPSGFLLVDSGGHYLEGTTDITRTFALGDITEEMRANYTRVLRSNLNLADVRFLKGCNGMNLDIIAREPLWEAGLDYKHGTGHGVGYVLNVHEGPNSFRWKQTPGRSEEHAIEPGMITTDEPGVYIEGQYGIRLENELVCLEGEKNEYGQFLFFENITYVPFDLDAVDVEQLTATERGRLNTYHAAVFETVGPLLGEEERRWLREATRAV